MRPDELPFVVRYSRRILKETEFVQTMRLVPFFIFETHNKTKLHMFSQIRPDV